MSFLSIAFLMALPLAVAPLILHFFDRRRKNVIEWGAMQFLQEASTRKTQARKLKQWLLLLMRIAAIAGLILALARPMLPSGYLGAKHRGETILVLDNSMSMLRTTDGVPSIDMAIQKALAELAEIPASERVRVLTTSPYPIWLANTDSMSNDQLASKIKQLEANQGQSDLLAALFTAVQVEHDPTQLSRRVVLITDGQATDWRTEDSAGWQRFQNVLNQASISTEIEIVQVDAANQQRNNIAVDRLSITRSVVGVGEEVEVAASLKSYSDTPTTPSNLLWSIDDQTPEERPLAALNAEESSQAKWNTSFDSVGTYKITCRAEYEDDLLIDNESSVVVEVVERIPIVIVEGAFELAELQQDSYFVQAALGWIDGKPMDGKSIYQPTIVSPDELATTDLSGQRVVVIPNLTRLEIDVVSRLTDFVSAGGGLWIGLGPRTDIDFFNQYLFADASGLAALKIEQIVDAPAPEEADEQLAKKNRIDPFRTDHPAIERIADTDQLDLDEVIIDRRFQFANDKDDVSVVLKLNDGEPLAIENLVGRGRVFIQAIPLRLQWSDLARTQSFVVMVRDWIDYLAQPQAPQFNLQPGQPIAWLTNLDAGDANAVLHTPRGDQIELTAQRRDAGFLFRSGRTRLPGEYRLELGHMETTIPFQVQRVSAESDLTSLSPNSEKQIRAATRRDPSAIDKTQKATTHSDPLWPYLLLGLIALIAAELFLSGVLARERFGSAGVPEFSDLETGGQAVDLGSTVDSNAFPTATSEILANLSAEAK